jgi:hypothetical protein
MEGSSMRLKNRLKEKLKFAASPFSCCSWFPRGKSILQLDNSFQTIYTLAKEERNDTVYLFALKCPLLDLMHPAFELVLIQILCFFHMFSLPSAV